MANTMKLGQIIEALSRANQEGRVDVFPIEDLKFTSLDSWRGVYQDLAIGYELSHDSTKVSDLLSTFKSAVKATFTGYKGGDFTMDLNTPVWVANYGSPSNATIDRIEIDKYGNACVYVGHAGTSF